MTEPAANADPFTRYVVPEIEVMFRVARSLTGNAADAEDLVQDALIRAYRAIDRFDGRHPRAWLLTIVRNTHLNRVRKKVPEPVRDAEAGERLFEQHMPEPSAEDAVIDPVFDAEVAAAYDALPDMFRAVVDLVDLDGLSYQEAADVLVVPIGTVMSRLHRARKRIRDHLARVEARGGDRR